MTISLKTSRGGVLGLLKLCMMAMLMISGTANAQTYTELDVSNFESTLMANNWTCVIFYDAQNTGFVEDSHKLLEHLHQYLLASKADISVGLARLDIRKHSYLRRIYTDEDDAEPFFEKFYENYPDNVDPLVGLSDKTFMGAGNVYWTSRIVVFSKDLNGYGELHNLEFKYNGDPPMQAAMIARWLDTALVGKPPELMTIVLPSPMQKQKDEALENLVNEVVTNNDFDYVSYKEARAFEEKQKPSDFILETGASKNPAPSLAVAGKDENVVKPFAYNKMGFSVIKDTTECLEELSQVIHRYLAWAESYEQLWDADRKAREDAQTSYGAHLQALNDQIKALITKSFGTEGEAATATTPESKNLGKMDTPPLKAYLEEMVFGIGRSPATLKAYIQNDLVNALGATAEERRANKNKLKTEKFVLLERMKEHMQVWMNAQTNPDRYSIFLAELLYQWHNLLVDFHNNLQTSYAEYRAKHPIKAEFPKASMSVLDMNDANNKDVLSNYNAFHDLYTKTGMPVVLSNVNLTKYHLTLEHMIQNCGTAEVTGKVKYNPAVGKKSNKNWAGLEDYTLDQSLVFSNRIKEVSAKSDSDSDSDSDEDSSDDDTDKIKVFDTTITLEQFVKLSRNDVKDLYLNNAALLDMCDKLLYENTLYGKNQTFQIPTVMGAYDLMQRITLYPFADTSIALFVGTKGTHSKLHLDPSAMGFFQYLVSGRKRWTVYHPSERPYLYSRIFSESFVPDVLGMDDAAAVSTTSTADAFLSQRYPLLHRTEQVYEFVQEPGQLVYIPPNCPHAVENLDDGKDLNVGIAMNVLPHEVAFGAHLHEQIHLAREFGYTELALKYKLFEESADQPATSSNSDSPLYMTLADFKAQM